MHLKISYKAKGLSSLWTSQVLQSPPWKENLGEVDELCRTSENLSGGGRGIGKIHCF